MLLLPVVVAVIMAAFFIPKIIEKEKSPSGSVSQSIPKADDKAGAQGAGSKPEGTLPATPNGQQNDDQHRTPSADQPAATPNLPTNAAPADPDDKQLLAAGSLDGLESVIYFESSRLIVAESRVHESTRLRWKDSGLVEPRDEVCMELAAQPAVSNEFVSYQKKCNIAEHAGQFGPGLIVKNYRCVLHEYQSKTYPPRGGAKLTLSWPVSGSCQGQRR
jgi:hypothetical protein